MRFKDISYLELKWPLCSAEQNHLCNFEPRLCEEQFYEIVLNFDQWFRRRCLLYYMSYLELWWLLCLAERNHLCNFGRGHHEKHFCENIKNLDK